MPRRKRDPKTGSLRERGCLHPHPQQVSDSQFAGAEFFDARDLLQVKYEMLRRVRVDGHTVTRAAADFGLSRPAFYEAQTAYERGGLPALLPRKKGPRRAHKLSEEVLEALNAEMEKRPGTDSAALVDIVRKRFGISVHPRSVERALARQKKNVDRHRSGPP